MSVRKLFDLSGRVALVTGGSRGLGLQIAEALGEMGARVALTARKRDELEAARGHLAGQGIESLPIACDMADAAAIPAMVEEAVAGLGPIDILVNNAGTTWGADMVEHPLEAWKKVMDLNLTAMFVASQEVGRRCMVPRRRGRIVNVASVLGLVGGGEPGRPGTIGYNTSKGGVVSFTRALAAEWARPRDHRERHRPGLLPHQDDQGAHGDDGRQGGEQGAAQPRGRPRGPEGRGRAARLGRFRLHHGPGHRGGRRLHRDLAMDANARPAKRSSPFGAHLGIRTRSRGAGRAVLELDLRPELMNVWDFAHGGLIMTLLDNAMSTAAYTMDAKGAGVVTVEMKTSFIAAGQGRLEAHGHCLHFGRSIAFCEGEVRDAAGKLVARASGTFAVRRRGAVQDDAQAADRP